MTELFEESKLSSDFSGSARDRPTSTGIRLRSMDPSRVAIVDFMMQKTVFDEYVSDKDSKICREIGLQRIAMIFCCLSLDRLSNQKIYS